MKNTVLCENRVSWNTFMYIVYILYIYTKVHKKAHNKLHNKVHNKVHIKVHNKVQQ